MKQTILKYILIFLTLSSCSGGNDLLNQVLELSGNNRAELEKTLNHYEKNPEKLEAARWLITNMPGHSYTWSPNIQTFADSLIKRELPKVEGDSLWNKLGKEGNGISQKKDLECISSDFLISNIDKAFEAWQNSPWREEVDFESFKKYILPYRVSSELLRNGWRDSLYNQYFPLVRNTKSAREAFQTIRKKIYENRHDWSYSCHYIVDPVALTHYRSGRCIDRCVYLASVCRAVGLPVALDHVGQWVNYSNNSHSWISLVLNDGTYTIVDDDSIARKLNRIDAATFDLHEAVPEDYPYKPMVKKRYAKIWRSNFHNTRRTIDSVFFKDENIGRYSPKQTDVSALYGLEGMVEIESDDNVETVSLNIYTLENGWKPLMTKMRQGRKTRFDRLCDSVLFLPVGHSGDSEMILGKPFYVSNGEKKEFAPDISSPGQVTLLRKYPMIARWFNRYQRFRGTRFEGSGYSDFRVVDTLFTIREIPTINNVFEIKSETPVRYIRSATKKDGVSRMEKIDIYDRMGNLLASEKGDNIDLVHSHVLGRIEFKPWNDGNFITPGHEYELQYWTGDSWKSLGSKVAQNFELNFDGVPRGALLILHDHTEGKEERPFSVIDGKQVWW